MAQHKAPTQVTVVTDEKSSFATLIESNWKLFAAVAVVIAVAILGMQYASNQSKASNAATWDRLASAMQLMPGGGITPSSVAALEEALADPKVAGTPAEPVGQVVLIQSLIQERRYDEARALVDTVQKAGFEPWAKVEFPLGPDGSGLTLGELVGERLAAQQNWEQGFTGLFENKPLPEGSPQVKVQTSAGDIVIGLYQEDAPKHVENFLKHVDSGFYAGTKFHRVIEGFMIQGGDPNTKDDEKIDEWGQGGPGYKVDREQNDLYHFKGVLSAAKQPNDFQSSGSQFFITTGEALWLDGQHTVYGIVVEGMDIVSSIEQGEIEAGDRPVDPVVVLEITRL